MTEHDWLTSEKPAAMLDWLSQGQPGRRRNHVFAAVSDRKLRLFACACCRLTQSMQYPEAQKVVRAAEEVAEEGVLRGSATERLTQARKSIDAIGDWFWCVTSIDVATTLRTTLSEQQPGIGNGGGSYLAQMAALLREVVGNPYRPVTLPPGPDVAVKAKCPTCDGVGWYNEIGPNTFPVTCWMCEGTGVNVTPAPGSCPWLTPQVLSLAAAAYDVRRRKVRCRACSGEGCSGNVGYLDDPRERCDGSGERWVDDGTLDPLTLAAAADALEEAGCGATSNTWNDGHEILAHLRSAGPHVRGCWALDLILGKQ